MKARYPRHSRHRGIAAVWVAAVVSVLLIASVARAQDCTPLISLFKQGLNTAQIAQLSGLSPNEVEGCRRILSQPIIVGPEGAPPQNAVGPPPRRAAGPPPSGNAVGPPPSGNAAGPPPVGHEVRRLP